VRPDRVPLAAEEEVGIELVRLDRNVAVNNVLLCDCMPVAGLNVPNRWSMIYRHEYVWRSLGGGCCWTGVEWGCFWPKRLFGYSNAGPIEGILSDASRRKGSVDMLQKRLAKVVYWSDEVHTPVIVGVMSAVADCKLSIALL
jgi:hypothetical protein